MKPQAGKVAVVTGGGSGIGRATAHALAREQVAVAVCDIRSPSADATAEEIRRDGGTADAYEADVTSAAQMEELAKRVATDFGVIDIVVNNAGIGPAPTATDEFPLERFHQVMDVNLWGVIHGSIFFLPHLKERPEANLVNVASEVGLLTFPRMAAYCTSKFAVRGFTESLRMELVRSSVKVSLVCPGSTKTPIMANSPVIEEQRRQAVARQFSGAWGLPPERVARAIVNAIRRDRPRVLVGPDTMILDAVARLFPGAHTRVLGPSLDRFMRRALGEG